MCLKSWPARVFIFLCSFVLISAKVTLAEVDHQPVVKDLSVDKENKTISYVLTRPATVRLRVGSRSGPLYRTLINWEQQKEGSHIIRWDGRDNSGTFNILDNEDFTFSFNYYLAGEEEGRIEEYLDSDLIFSDYFIGRAPKLLHRSQNHKTHRREYCRDLQVLFKLPENLQRKDSLPEIRESLPIMITLADKDKFWFRQERFSLNIFIDGVFVAGEALGYLPYTWNFHPQGINKGKHLITVNLKGFNDHIAAGSLPIYISPVEEEEDVRN